MLAATSDIDFLPVAAAYVTANTAGILSHVPGGLGVIEAVLLSLVPGVNVVGALVAFRAIYFLVPFFIGALVFGVRRSCAGIAAPPPLRDGRARADLAAGASTARRADRAGRAYLGCPRSVRQGLASSEIPTDHARLPSRGATRPFRASIRVESFYRGGTPLTESPGVERTAARLHLTLVKRPR